jgi:tetratricopeptide (TPR) repeat protein
VLPAQDQRAARAGHQALFAGAYTTAVYFLKQVWTAEPRHLSAWKDLCRAYLALDQVDAAIDACHKQIDVYPDGPDVYRILSQALWRKGKRDEAISALRRQIEIDPERLVRARRSGAFVLRTRKIRGSRSRTRDRRRDGTKQRPRPRGSRRRILGAGRD